MANKISFIIELRANTTLLLDTIDKLKGQLQQAQELNYFDDEVMTQADVDLSKTAPGAGGITYTPGDPVSNDPATKADVTAAMITMSAIDDILESGGHYSNLYKVRR